MILGNEFDDIDAIEMRQDPGRQFRPPAEPEAVARAQLPHPPQPPPPPPQDDPPLPQDEDPELQEVVDDEDPQPLEPEPPPLSEFQSMLNSHQPDPSVAG